MRMPVVELQWLLKKCATRETSAGPELWTPNNPLFGHCAVAATVAQDFLGGKIVSRFFPAEWAERFKNRSHYWNVRPDGSVVDFSRGQFPPDFPLDDFMAGKLGESRGDSDMRDYLLGVAATKQRYELLCGNISGVLGGQPILLDEKFQRCWELAFSEESTCRKMRFGCVVYDNDEGWFVTGNANRQMTDRFGKGRFCSPNGSYCAREHLEHRVDPSIGDCGHAAIWCLRDIFERQYKPSDLPSFDFYEQGFFPNGDPWFRPRPEYTCLSCENTFALFGLDKIWGVYDGRWTALLTENSFYSCAGYAVGEKKT